MKPIREIAETLGVREEYLHYYGKYTAKLDLGLLNATASRPAGKLILVTAVTPTSHGEGKTVVSIGLAQGLAKTGRKAVVTLREPSLGPVFGIKGGATGGGASQVIPSGMINLHFNGDFHAVSSAHNLLAALLDAHIHHGNTLGIDVDNIFWPRALDMNDRALRHVIVGLGGKNNGVPRETGFVITAASEIMAILALSKGREDLRQRLSEIVVGLSLDGKPIRAADLNATGAMMVLLNEAIMPNLVQTTEHVPAFVHAGPFANIAHGTSSVLSQRMGLQLADWVVNETGFAADLGAEKYFDLVMPSSGLKPSVVVLIASLRAIEAQGGFANIDRHLSNLAQFGVPVVVAINRFASDSAEQLAALKGHCRQLGVEAVDADVFAHGGDGGRDLAEAVVAAAANTSHSKPLYNHDLSLEAKIERVARAIYGAAGVYFESGTRKKLRQYEALGYAGLPVCIAKTQSSLSDNPKLLGAPSGFTLTVTDVHLSAGAGFIVVIAGNMLRMPGLGKTPQAFHMDVTPDGEIVGLQ